MTRSIHSIQAAKISYVVMSVLLCALGVVLMIWPGLSVTAIGIASGVMLIVLGLVKLLGYFSRDLYRLAFQFDLALGILLLVLGCVILSSPDRAMSFLCLILGIAVAVDGWFKVQMALDARRFGLRSWWLILTTGVLTPDRTGRGIPPDGERRGADDASGRFAAGRGTDDAVRHAVRRQDRPQSAARRHRGRI